MARGFLVVVVNPIRGTRTTVPCSKWEGAVAVIERRAAIAGRKARRRTARKPGHAGVEIVEAYLPDSAGGYTYISAMRPQQER